MGNAFNDIIFALNRSKSTMDMVNADPQQKSSPFFTEISANRKVELLTVLMNEILQNTILFKERFVEIMDECDKHRDIYLKQRNNAMKRMKDEVKTDDKIMRGIHRSLPCYWSDFESMCKAKQRGKEMTED